MQPGDNLPSFPFTATQGINANFDDYRGQWLVLYFYPKDATPGWTIEGENFRDAYTQFSAVNTVVFGISRDKLASHERFKTKHAFPFELIDKAKRLGAKWNANQKLWTAQLSVVEPICYFKSIVKNNKGFFFSPLRS